MSASVVATQRGRSRFPPPPNTCTQVEVLSSHDSGVSRPGAALRRIARRHVHRIDARLVHPSTSFSPAQAKSRGNVENRARAKCGNSVSDGSCSDTGRTLDSPLHRARSASRSKRLLRAVGGSRRFTGEVDESATGSVNFCPHSFGAHGRIAQLGLRKRNWPQIARNPAPGPLNVPGRLPIFPLARSTERE